MRYSRACYILDARIDVSQLDVTKRVASHINQTLVQSTVGDQPLRPNTIGPVAPVQKGMQQQSLHKRFNICSFTPERIRFVSRQMGPKEIQHRRIVQSRHPVPRDRHSGTKDSDPWGQLHIWFGRDFDDSRQANYSSNRLQVCRIHRRKCTTVFVILFVIILNFRNLSRWTSTRFTWWTSRN